MMSERMVTFSRMCVCDNFYSVVLLPDAMSKLHKLYIHLFNTYLVNTYISGFVLGA